jgi:hypothetical protein
VSRKKFRKAVDWSDSAESPALIETYFPAGREAAMLAP